LAFKLSLVEQVEKGQFTYKEAQRRYGIQGRSTVLVWLRKHGTLDWSSKRELPMTKETPEQKIKRLEKALQDKSDYAYLLEETLKNVDKQVGGNFRKKFLSSLPKRLKPKDK
jgi:transposase-like protein